MRRRIAVPREMMMRPDWVSSGLLRSTEELW